MPPGVTWKLRFGIRRISRTSEDEAGQNGARSHDTKDLPSFPRKIEHSADAVLGIDDLAARYAGATLSCRRV